MVIIKLTCLLLLAVIVSAADPPDVVTGMPPIPVDNYDRFSLEEDLAKEDHKGGAPLSVSDLKAPNPPPQLADKLTSQEQPMGELPASFDLLNVHDITETPGALEASTRPTFIMKIPKSPLMDALMNTTMSTSDVKPEEMSTEKPMEPMEKLTTKKEEVMVTTLAPVKKEDKMTSLEQIKETSSEKIMTTPSTTVSTTSASSPTTTMANKPMTSVGVVETVLNQTKVTDQEHHAHHDHDHDVMLQDAPAPEPKPEPEPASSEPPMKHTTEPPKKMDKVKESTSSQLVSANSTASSTSSSSSTKSPKAPSSGSSLSPAALAVAALMMTLSRVV